MKRFIGRRKCFSGREQRRRSESVERASEQNGNQNQDRADEEQRQIRNGNGLAWHRLGVLDSLDFRAQCYNNIFKEGNYPVKVTMRRKPRERLKELIRQSRDPSQSKRERIRLKQRLRRKQDEPAILAPSIPSIIGDEKIKAAVLESRDE
jgi:hypothetical protein